MELKQVKREILYTGRSFDLIVDEVEYPSGRRSVREIARHPGGAVIVPLFGDGNVMLIRQLRYPLGRHIFELPAGKLNVGEEPVVAAARELEEETGWTAARLEKLVSIYRMPLQEAIGMISGGEIQDGKTIVGLLLTERLLRDGGIRLGTSGSSR